MSKKTREEILISPGLKETFKFHPAVKVVIATSDLQFFLEDAKSYAMNHARQTGEDWHEFTREEVEAIKTSPKKKDAENAEAGKGALAVESAKTKTPAVESAKTKTPAVESDKTKTDLVETIPPAVEKTEEGTGKAGTNKTKSKTDKPAK